ncbi:PA0069 family radical SAM protein [Jannaschia aquimarina]|uniref:MoaA_1 protein n=1 Tax=Jannaschia aquimarina TaxID=935700 RepID=A0A0D1ECL8_9RHOB|nr:PA0069 family radical SAM protein [Jannaschia aquimarina]KIT14671.1 Cyclic pyranopterin monophosphate synthase [Jannaschia aquimarina]SNT37940.1 DNA repair photolyase [Jannaschia aquimarina]
MGQAFRSFDTPAPVQARGAVSNLAGRFEPYSYDAPLPGRMRTELREERAGRIVSTNRSPDLGFDRSINPYRGCEHGCIYCYARPTHAFLGLSPGLDFETRITAKTDAPEALRRELSRKGYAPQTIMLGANTDPYQPAERDRAITRGLLEVLRDFRHPVGITTKGTLVERDADILAEMGPELCRVGLSVTTLDADLARRLEPRVPAPARRLKAIETLAKAGIQVRVMVSPIIPGLTDHEVEAVLSAAREAGAVAASMIPLRLPAEVAPLFEEWLRTHVPGEARKVLNRVRQFHGGKLYDAGFGHRMRGRGVHADLLQQRFRRACEAEGLKLRMPNLRTDLFEVPAGAGAQLALF